MADTATMSNSGSTTINAAFQQPRRRAAPDYDVNVTGEKGNVTIPGVFRGVEKVDKDANSVTRERSALGGMFKREDTYSVRRNDDAVQELVRDFKTTSNPLRTRTVKYDELGKDGDTIGAAKREMDVRFAGTQVGYKYNETDRGKQYTQVRAVAYSMDVKDSENTFKKEKGIQQKETNLLGMVKRTYDVDAEGKQTLTGRQNGTFKKQTNQIDEKTNETTISRLGGLITKTYQKPVEAKKEENGERLTTQRRIGSYTMTATAASEGAPATKEQKLAGVFKRTETVPNQGDEKTIKTSVLGMSFSRSVKLSDEEKTLRDKQLAKTKEPEPEKSVLGKIGDAARTTIGKAQEKFVSVAGDKPLQKAADALGVAKDFVPMGPAKVAITAAAYGLNKMSQYNQRQDAQRESNKSAGETMNGQPIREIRIPQQRPALARDKSAGSVTSEISSLSNNNTKQEAGNSATVNTAASGKSTWGRVGDTLKAGVASVTQNVGPFIERAKERFNGVPSSTETNDSSSKTKSQPKTNQVDGGLEERLKQLNSSRDNSQPKTKQANGNSEVALQQPNSSRDNIAVNGRSESFYQGTGFQHPNKPVHPDTKQSARSFSERSDQSFRSERREL